MDNPGSPVGEYGFDELAVVPAEQRGGTEDFQQQRLPGNSYDYSALSFEGCRNRRNGLRSGVRAKTVQMLWKRAGGRGTAGDIKAPDPFPNLCLAVASRCCADICHVRLASVTGDAVLIAGLPYGHAEMVLLAGSGYGRIMRGHRTLRVCSSNPSR